MFSEFNNSKLITFTDVLGVDQNYRPSPALRHVPEWYKSTPSYINEKRVVENGQTPHTIKRCVPVLDAMTAGYIITTYADVQITIKDGIPWYEWRMGNAITFHPVEQASLHPASNGAPFPKWTNPWAIKTPPGYSCLIIPPLHNPNGIFTILSGVVDTDTYTAPINFPFTLDDISWQGVIPAGTPMAQVIPFKRNDWVMKLGNKKDRKQQGEVTTRLRSIWFNSYRRQFWKRKQYR